SGTAGVLELAHYFAHQPKPKRGMLFMTFAGEELGLLGSGYYANHPELPVSKAVTMINLDMIGRAKDGKIYIGGAGSGSTLRASRASSQTIPIAPNSCAWSTRTIRTPATSAALAVPAEATARISEVSPTSPSPPKACVSPT